MHRFRARDEMVHRLARTPFPRTVEVVLWPEWQTAGRSCSNAAAVEYPGIEGAY